MISREKVFCDCCGAEIGGLDGKALFTSLIVCVSRPRHYCFGCSKELLKVWDEKTEEIQKRQKTEKMNKIARRILLGRTDNA